MVERIERVTRIKRLRFNNDELFERRSGFEEKAQEETFTSIFKDEIEKKKKQSSENPSLNKAYLLEVGRPTQSLFYQGKADISEVKGRLPHAG